MEEQVKKWVNPPKKEKKQRAPVTPISEPALPMLLALVVFTICFVALVINNFIYSFSDELLAPVILQLVALVLPAYLVIMLTSPDKSAFSQMKDIGFHTVKAEYVFFILFSALFASCASLVLTLAFGGAYDASRGVTLLGVFTAGENEYTVSVPYIILTYAIIPAFAEEFLYRGVILSRLEKISFPFAAVISTVVCALSGFALGGIIPSLFIGLLSVFVLYTTRSLWACVILHFIFNIYRLFLETNISAYFLSAQSNLLLVMTVVLALAISSLLFFSESARIFCKKAEKIKSREARSEKKLGSIKNIPNDLRAALAFRPTLVFSIVCLGIFVATVIINYVI